MTRREPPAFLVVGHLNKAHGTKGELFVWSLTDHPGSHFAPGVALFPALEEAQSPAPDHPPLEVETVRPYRKGFLVKFKGWEDRTAAEELRGFYLLRPFDEIDDLEEGEVFYHELLGSEVHTVDGTFVGSVREVYQLKPAELLEVVGPDGSKLIPFSKEVVVQVEREAGRVVIDPPPGLLDL